MMSEPRRPLEGNEGSPAVVAVCVLALAYLAGAVLLAIIEGRF